LKLLVDENLPPRLVHDLADLLPDSAHVSSLGFGSAPRYCHLGVRKGAWVAFLTKDKDFANLSIAWGAPPKVILLQTGNCSTTRLIEIIRNNAIRFSDFEGETRRSLLILR
jgi:predicted nuclease of predicted toxin-antitoxin system